MATDPPRTWRSKLSAKDYSALSGILKDSRTLDEAREKIAAYLAWGNERFDKRRFLAECGFGGAR